MTRGLAPRPLLLLANVLSFVSLVALASPETTPDASARPTPASLMRRVWRLEGVQVLWHDLGNTPFGKVLVVGQGQAMLGLDLASGRTLWTAPHALPARWTTSVRVTPLRVLATSTKNLAGYSAETGKRIWIRSPLCDFIPLSVYGEVALGQCSAKRRGCGPAAADPLVALDMKTGAVRWRHLPREGLFRQQSDGNLLFYIDNVRRPPPGPHPGHLVALELASGKVVWQVPIEDAEGSLVVGENTVIVFGSYMTGFAKAAGRRLWTAHPRSSRPGEPAWSIGDRGAVVDDHMALPGPTGFVLYAMNDGSAGEVIPYPSEWQSGRSRSNATLYSSERVLFAWTSDKASRVPNSIYVWENGTWVERASPGEDSEIEAIGGGYVVVSSGDLLETYSLATPALPGQ